MYSILIVDDETIILEGLKEVAENSGLPFKKTETASDAETALKLYREEPFDIVLTDISMPQMNGLKMVEEMRKIWKHTEVIFLTGFGDFEFVRTALRLGSFDYLLKPMTDEELTERLEAAVKKLDDGWVTRFLEEPEFPEKDSEGEASFLLRKMFEEKGKKEAYFQPEAVRFSEERLRVITVRYGQQAERLSPESIHRKLFSVLRSLTFGYGQMHGFSCGENESVFLIQKASEGEGNFSGIYRALEEMQSYFLEQLDVGMTIFVSHHLNWNDWPLSVRKMLEKAGQMLRFGGLSVFEEEKEAEDPGNLLMYAVRDYIEKNPGQDLSLGTLSLRFHINPSYLSRAFHQTLQMSLSSWIAASRIAKAKQMLENTGESIYNISRECGFDSPGYFTKVFRKAENLSPKEYRTRCSDGKDESR